MLRAAPGLKVVETVAGLDATMFAQEGQEREGSSGAEERAVRFKVVSASEAETMAS